MTDVYFPDYNDAVGSETKPQTMYTHSGLTHPNITLHVLIYYTNTLLNIAYTIIYGDSEHFVVIVRQSHKQAIPILDSTLESE